MIERQTILGVKPGSSVLTGDSLAALLPILDLYTHIHNRGIGGQTVGAVTLRLPFLLENEPARMLLLVGTNDFLREEADGLEERYERMLDRAIERSSRTEFIVLAIPPMRYGMQPCIPSPEVIDRTNRRIAELAEARGIRFVDTHPPLREPDGRLREDCTRDGVHLTTNGYLRLAPLLADFFSSVERQPSESG